jgi:hypothetical protein
MKWQVDGQGQMALPVYHNILLLDMPVVSIYGMTGLADFVIWT